MARKELTPRIIECFVNHVAKSTFENLVAVTIDFYEPRAPSLAVKCNKRRVSVRLFFHDVVQHEEGVRNYLRARPSIQFCTCRLTKCSLLKSQLHFRRERTRCYVAKIRLSRHFREIIWENRPTRANARLATRGRPERENCNYSVVSTFHALTLRKTRNNYDVFRTFSPSKQRSRVQEIPSKRDGRFWTYSTVSQTDTKLTRTKLLRKTDLISCVPSLEDILNFDKKSKFVPRINFGYLLRSVTYRGWV